jgi:hypothetical protein
LSTVPDRSILPIGRIYGTLLAELRVPTRVGQS